MNGGEWLSIIPGAVLSDKSLSTAAKVTFAAVNSFSANGTKDCFPSQAAIAERAGLDVRSIWRHIKELTSAGLLQVTRRGKRQSNTYVILQKCVLTNSCTHNFVESDSTNLKNPSIKRNIEKNTYSEAKPETPARTFFECTFFHVTEPQAQEYSRMLQLKPETIKHELGKMALWLNNNPAKRKKNYPKFIATWLSKVEPDFEPGKERAELSAEATKKLEFLKSRGLA